MSKNEITDLKPSEIQTTKELLELGLYYSENELDLFSDDMQSLYTFHFIDKRAKAFQIKKVKTSKRDTQYIVHKASNYTISTLTSHILTGSPLEKGIDRKYSPRQRDRRTEPKPSLLTKLIHWLRG